MAPHPMKSLTPEGASCTPHAAGEASLATATALRRITS